MVENPLANAGDKRDACFIPALGRFLEEAWQPTPVFLPGKSHGQRSLAGYSPWGRRVRQDLVIEQPTNIANPLFRKIFA